MIGLALSLLLSAAATPPPEVGPFWDPKLAEMIALKNSGRIISLGQACKAVAAEIPGQLEDAGLENEGSGPWVYRLLWRATDGRRMDVFVDAASGAVLRSKRRG